MPTIKTINGNNPGKTIAIFSGIHGNEKAGILAVQKLKETLKIQNGTVHLVEVNEPAIQENTRMINKNLNRLFTRKKDKNETYEDTYAKELMDLLDTCDALLDLHSYNDEEENRTIFAITDTHCIDLAKNLDVTKVITGFKYLEEGGSDDYMNIQGKIGICVELGSVNISEEMSQTGIRIAKQFLNYFDIIQEAPESKTEKVILNAKTLYRKNTDEFAFTKEYKTFDIIPEGTVFATDGLLTLQTKEESTILFPRTKYAIGIEAFILAEKIDESKNPL